MAAGAESRIASPTQGTSGEASTAEPNLWHNFWREALEVRAQELTEVREAHRFDEAALERYLTEALEGFSGPVTVRQFEGGQSNPTFLVSAGGQRFVLRKKPPGRLLPTAHMVEREYRVLRALAGTGVPVPTVALLCEDDSVIGTPFFVMQFVEGRIFWDPTLPALSPAERGAIYSEMNRVLSLIHSVDYASVGLAGFGKPGNYFARQIDRWTQQYLAAKTEDFPAMDRLIEWLPAHVPSDDSTSIVHGDFRLDNMIFHATEARVVALLDWELSTIGHPLADLAYNCMPYHLARPGAPSLAKAAGAGSGIPTERQYVASYENRMGRPMISDFNFYLAFSLFRLASITQGVYARGLQGNASSTRALESIETARSSASAAVHLIGDARFNPTEPPR